MGHHIAIGVVGVSASPGAGHGMRVHTVGTRSRIAVGAQASLEGQIADGVVLIALALRPCCRRGHHPEPQRPVPGQGFLPGNDVLPVERGRRRPAIVRHLAAFSLNGAAVDHHVIHVQVAVAVRATTGDAMVVDEDPIEFPYGIDKGTADPNPGQLSRLCSWVCKPSGVKL